VIIKWDEMGGACSTYGEMTNTYKIFVERHENRPLGRPKRRLRYNIKMDLKRIQWNVWTGFIWLSTGPVAGYCEHGNKPSGVHKRRGIFTS
jgi:hypothetical protein